VIGRRIGGLGSAPELSNDSALEARRTDIRDLMIPFEEKMSRGGGAAIEEASRFFMKQGPVYEALHSIVAKLEALKIPYAVAGGMALVAYGYDRNTVDVNVLVTPEGLQEIHRALDGPDYVPSGGAKQLRDVETSVRIGFLVSGEYPGDGKPKPVAFPNPADVAVEMNGIKYLGLVNLIELKLASGISNPGRMKDLGDVQELIRILKLPREFGGKLNAYVRGKFEELHEGVERDQSSD